MTVSYTDVDVDVTARNRPLSSTLRRFQTRPGTRGRGESSAGAGRPGYDAASNSFSLSATASGVAEDGSSMGAI
jgi:hypothetical protein